MLRPHLHHGLLGGPRTMPGRPSGDIHDCYNRRRLQRLYLCALGRGWGGGGRRRGPTRGPSRAIGTYSLASRGPSRGPNRVTNSLASRGPNRGLSRGTGTNSRGHNRGTANNSLGGTHLGSWRRAWEGSVLQVRLASARFGESLTMRTGCTIQARSRLECPPGDDPGKPWCCRLTFYWAAAVLLCLLSWPPKLPACHV